MKKSSIVTLFVLVVVLAVAAFTVHLVQKRSAERSLDQSPASTVLKSSTTTANFTDFDGNEADLEQFLGQTLIVNSWASWAPSSVSELQLLTNVAKNYRDKGVVVIAINRAEPRSTAEAFLSTLGLTDEVLLIVDKDDRYYKAIEGYTMPETVIYDTKGDVIHHKRGAITSAELTQVLDTALSNVD